MLKRWLATGLFLLLMEQSALAQVPAAPGTFPPPPQLSPVPHSPPPQVPMHPPVHGYPQWGQQAPMQPPPAGYEFIPSAANPPMQQPWMPYPSAPPPPRKFPLEATWDNGLFLESHDKQFRLHVGGNAQVDSTWLIGPKGVFAIPGGGDNGLENASATFLRRVRLRFEGDIWEQFDYIVEYDFAHATNENSGLQPASLENLIGSPTPANVWIQVRDVPCLGNVRIGNQVKPIGFTNQVYQGFLPFMERADNMDAFYGPFDSGFSLGITARDHTDNEGVTWQYGIYRPVIESFGIALNKLAWGGRVTGLPVYEDEGRHLVHFGFGTFNGEIVQNQLRARARPVLRNGPGFAVPILVDTGNITGSRRYALAPEFAMVLGSWTFQAEWTGQYLTQATPPGGPNQGTVLYHGGYVQVLYFLTGEYQSYDMAAGAFGRVVPRSNLRFKKGEGCISCGAWQVGARLSYLDLNAKGIRGGQVYDWTLGLNWFLNPNMKIQFNYIATHRDAPQDVAQGWINGLGVQAGYDF